MSESCAIRPHRSAHSTDRTLIRQLVKYALVGIGGNAALYLAYLGLTALGVGYLVAMSIAYAAGVAITFLLNRSWTFAHGGAIAPALRRYLASYAAGYLLNLAGLYVLVEMMAQPHQLAQGVLIVCVALVLFLMHRFWVFKASVNLASP